MKKTILSIWTILTLVLSVSTAVAVPSGPVLALEAPSTASHSSPRARVGQHGPGYPLAWGFKGATGLGDGTVGDKKSPVQVSGLSDVVEIAAGSYHDLALKADGTVWAWGLNSTGQLGDGTTTNRNIPVQVSGLTGVVNIAAGREHSLALKSDGTIRAWGNNQYDQLGDKSYAAKSTPVQVSGLSDVVDFAAGQYYSLAVKSDGTVWFWGLKRLIPGGLGGQTSPDVPLVPEMVSITGVHTVATGSGHNLALKKDGTVWAWGINYYGQLGDGTIGDKSTPVQVSGLSDVVDIAAGEYYSLAVKSDGTVWAWGNNSRGQLGDGTTTKRLVPGRVNLPGFFQEVAAGTDHSLARSQYDGSVWAWGYNYYGELGDNTTTNRLVPVQVSGLEGVLSIAANTYHSLALKGGQPVVTPVPTIPPVLGIAPVTVTSPPSSLTPSTQTPGAAPIPATGLVPIAKATPRSAPTKSSSGILVYASPERIAGPGAGGVFSSSVWAATGSQVISSGDLSFSFDAAALEVTSITPGSVFGVTPMVVQNVYDNANGTARLVAARAAGSAAAAPPPPPIPPTQSGDPTAPLPASGGASTGGNAGAATPSSPSSGAEASDADRILAEIIAAADAEATRILAILSGAANANAAANTLAGALGAASSNAPVADADAPAHHAAEAVPTGGAATGTGSAVPPPPGTAYGTQGSGASAAGPPSGNAYFGSAETGYVASNSLATIRFKVKSQAKPGDYQVSISKAGLADTKGQDIQIRLMTGSTITIGGPMKMGDLNGDGLVDYRDLGVFGGAYGASSAQSSFNSMADLNGDGVINYLDLAIFGANYGK